MIATLRGCNFISAMDATSFFYHWPISPPHRERLTVDSHRGQETFNVAVMGHTNSVQYVQRWIDRLLKDCRSFLELKTIPRDSGITATHSGSSSTCSWSILYGGDRYTLFYMEENARDDGQHYRMLASDAHRAFDVTYPMISVLAHYIISY